MAEELADVHIVGSAQEATRAITGRLSALRRSSLPPLSVLVLMGWSNAQLDLAFLG
jgi:hypothetical protein